MKATALKKMYLEFFKQKGHAVMGSASLLIEVFPEIVKEVEVTTRLKSLETNSRNLAIVCGSSPLHAACACAALAPMERFIEEYQHPA
jgi:hypothetical protein